MELSAIVRTVIQMATLSWASAAPKREELPWGRIQLTPEKRALREYLIGQPEPVIYALTLIMYAGRGDFNITHLINLYEQIRSRFPRPEDAVFQMMEKAPLPEYLEAGLGLLADNGIDVDQLLRRWGRMVSR